MSAREPVQAATGKSARRRCCIKHSAFMFPGAPPLLHARGEEFGLRLPSPLPALLLRVVLPSAAGSAPALHSGCVFQAWLVDIGENRDAVNSQGCVCELLPCKDSAGNTECPGSWECPAVPRPELSQGSHSSKMSPEVEEQSLPAPTQCSWECWGSLPSLSIFSSTMDLG